MRIMQFPKVLVAVTIALSTSLVAQADDKKFFSTENLVKKSFENADLEGAKFIQVRAPGSNFRGANLEDADFIMVALADADFRGAKFDTSTGFFQCTMQDSNFEGVDLNGADFRKVNLRGANLKSTKGWGDVSDCSFSKADLSGADLSEAKGDMDTVQFSGAIYDAETKFPEGFDPAAQGLKLAAE